MRKGFSREYCSSTIPNYKLAFLMQLITQTPPPPPASADLPASFAWALIDQNRRLVTCDALLRGLTEVLCDDSHRKGELVIGNGRRTILTAESFSHTFLLRGPIRKKQLGTGLREWS
jgi:hypothetical protein